MTMTTLTQRGRPRGHQRGALAELLRQRSRLRVRDVMHGLGCTLDQADKLVRRACDAREIERVGSERADGAKRPVAVYAPVRAGVDAEGGLALAMAMRAWAR